MHAIFIPYGKRSEVELLLRDMEAQKHWYKFTKGKKTMLVPMQGSVRILPFGFMEYVFPKEDMDMVLTTLSFDSNNKPRYMPGSFKLSIFRKFLKAEEIPEFKKDKKYLWIRANVSIIPIGIREDGEVTEPKNTIYAGYVHEAV
jgi:hypothetical protein